MAINNFCSDVLASEILATSKLIEVPAGAVIMKPGDPVEGSFILEQGAVKLFRICEHGNRHLLYLLRDASMCALSTLTSLIGGTSDVLVEAEVFTRIRFLPKDRANQLFFENEEWRALVLREILSSWKDSMSMLDQLAFNPLKKRLESYLLIHSKLSDRKIVRKSHAEIADELYVSREAVSRTLKGMETEGDVHLGHGSIKVLDVLANKC